MVQDDDRQLRGRQFADLELANFGLAPHAGTRTTVESSAFTTPDPSLARLPKSVTGAPRSKMKGYVTCTMIRASTSM